MVAGIILAAGSSARMGEPKALLKIGDKTFLQHIADVLISACIIDLVIVIGADEEKIKPTLDWFSGKIVRNSDWPTGQLSSIIAGINALEQNDLHGAMICPVDHPLLTQRLIVDLLQVFWKSNKRIIVPTYQGRRGHPVIFESSLFNDLRAAPPEIGARAVVQKHRAEVIEVPTEEEGVLTNIDTPADYGSMKLLSTV